MKTSNVFSTFHSHKIPPLAFLGLLQTDDRFPYSFYTSLCFEQSTSFPGVLGYFTLPRTIINLFSRVLRENPGNEVVEQSEWLTCGLIIFRVLSFTFREDSSRANQVPCQTCCVEVSSLGDFSLRP